MSLKPRDVTPVAANDFDVDQAASSHPQPASPCSPLSDHEASSQGTVEDPTYNVMPKAQDLPDVLDDEIHGDPTATNDQQPCSQSSHLSNGANAVGAEARPEWLSMVVHIEESLEKDATALTRTIADLRELKGLIQHHITREVWGTTQGALMANGRLKRKADNGDVKDFRADIGPSQKKGRTSGNLNL